ncbi:MAG: hypothetical protein ABJD07_16305 [Gemmatimonadaceae bacterium]
MRIHGKAPEITQPKAGTNVQPSTQPTQSPAVSGEQAAPKRERNDHVRISDAGRAKAAEATTHASGLDPQRAADIRRKVLEGAYNSVQVVDTVARKILDELRDDDDACVDRGSAGLRLALSIGFREQWG